MLEFELFLKIDGWQKYPNYSVKLINDHYHVRNLVILNRGTTRVKRYWHFMCKFSTLSEALDYLHRNRIRPFGKGLHKKQHETRRHFPSDADI